MDLFRKFALYKLTLHYSSTTQFMDLNYLKFKGDEMICDYIHKLLYTFGSSYVAKHKSKYIAKHMKTCGFCKKELNNMQKLQRLLDSVETTCAPLNFSIRVIEIICGIKQ